MQQNSPGDAGKSKSLVIFRHSIFFSILLGSFFVFGIGKASASCPGGTCYVKPSGAGTTCVSGTECTMTYALNTKASSGNTIIAEDGTYTGTTLGGLNEDSYWTVGQTNITITGATDYGAVFIPAAGQGRVFQFNATGATVGKIVIGDSTNTTLAATGVSVKSSDPIVALTFNGTKIYGFSQYGIAAGLLQNLTMSGGWLIQGNPTVTGAGGGIAFGQDIAGSHNLSNGSIVIGGSTAQARYGIIGLLSVAGVGYSETDVSVTINNSHATNAEARDLKGFTTVSALRPVSNITAPESTLTSGFHVANSTISCTSAVVDGATGTLTGVGGYGVIIGDDGSANSGSIAGGIIRNSVLTGTFSGSAHGYMLGYVIGGKVYNNKYISGGTNAGNICYLGKYDTNSLFYDNLAIGAFNGGAFRFKGSNGSAFYNNVSYVPSAETAAGTGQYATDSSVSSNFKNNIILNAGSGALVYTNVESLSAVALDYNLYYSTGTLNANPWSLSGTGYSNLNWSTYRAANEPHSVNSDPYFSNAATSNFHLTNTSPAINAGTNSVWSGTASITDYEGSSITNGSGTITASGGTVDIGAYEFQDSTAPTTSVDVSAGIYNSSKTVTLTCSDGTGVGCDQIYYTLDGSTPTTSSPLHGSSPIALTISSTTTVKFFSQDRNLNSETPVQTKIYTIDTTAPTVIFSNDVAQGPTQSDTITGDWGDSSVKKWKYNDNTTCSTTASDYPNLSTTSMNQATATNNGKYICLYGEDTATNKTVKASAYPINIDITAPTLSDLSPNNQILNVTTTSTNLTLTTTETATCKYSTTSGTAYGSMTAFDTTNSTTHSTFISGLSTGTSYNYYLKCQDLALNETAESSLSFSVAPEENDPSLNSIKVTIGRTINKFKDTLHIKKDKFKLKGEDSQLANGQVKIYKGDSLWKTIDADSTGFWNALLKFKDGAKKNLKLKFFDQYGTLLNTQKAKADIDTEDPAFTAFPPNNKVIYVSYQRDENRALVYQSKDNDKIDKYRIEFDGKITERKSSNFGKVQSFLVPKNTPKGTYTFKVTAYDQAGNKTEQEVSVVVR